jgi:class 3 adenylate cyclase/tetratricopeptide (TPR) repeat protein
MIDASSESALLAEPTAGDPGRDAGRAAPYVPRMLLQHLARGPAAAWWTSEGTAAFIDISGFTKLSEALARKGREGAEHSADAIGGICESMLAVAYANGGSLLKFGGDALLLWFDGDRHEGRACRAAIQMRARLADVGRIAVDDETITLRMAQGVHSGHFHFFAVGVAHTELLTAGPAWTRLVNIQHGAEPDQIAISAETASQLPAACVGPPAGTGLLLLTEPPGAWEDVLLHARPDLPSERIAHCLPSAIRAHVAAGGGSSEHRPVTIAFIRFEGTDERIAQHGAEATASALERLLARIEDACRLHDVTFLASDVDAEGGKIILTGGAPKVTGNDEERVLLALRKVVDGDLPLPVRIGVHRGTVFAGDIGPLHRRTYTVMGDAVNLTARLMAKAERGTIYATADVLERSKTLFQTTVIAPFAVKGKAEPVQAWSVAQAQSSRARQQTVQRLPLTGRNAELGVMRKAFSSARAGQGRVIDIVGEHGVGKTRLLEALRDAAAGFRQLRATCEAYTAAKPYALWREILREHMGLGRDDSDETVVERLRDAISARATDLEPWLPLIAAAFDVEILPTPEIELLADSNRRARLHESVVRFLEATITGSALIEIEDAHHIDEASGELLAFLAGVIATKPWLIAVSRSPAGGFSGSDAPTVVRIELKALAPQDALRMAQLATQHNPLPAHVLEVVAKRSGGNPQFLRDLLRTAIESGGVADLPDSAEAAAMAQIDALSPDDRAIVRRAAVFGLTFHPRMLGWFADEGEGTVPPPDVWERLRELFDEEPDGYLRFRRSLLRDAAYEGLPYRTRRKLHATVAAHLEEELDYPDEAAGILSLHYYEAGDFERTWRYGTLAAVRAESAYAYVEAARLYMRALDAGRRVEKVDAREFAETHVAMGIAWFRSGEFQKAAEAFSASRPLLATEPLADVRVMLKLAAIEEKLGNYREARRWTEQARDALAKIPGDEAARESARAAAWYATVLQAEGKTVDALDWAERTIAEAEPLGDAEALGDAYFVKGWAFGEMAKEGALELMQRSLEEHRRAGNLVRQAGVLMSLGVVCQWEGQWDEAMSYYKRGRDESAKIGDTVGAALARINVAEILTDRGEWAEAEAMLLETLPFWKTSQYHYYLAACLSLLGRVALRRGRLDEALTRLQEAKANFLHVGAEQEVPAVDARIAECHVALHKPDLALELLTPMLDSASSSTGVARIMPLITRIQGHALLQQGDAWGARDALDASLAAARERNDYFEATLTTLSLIELDRLEGVEPALDIVEESKVLLARLKIRAVPAVPLPAQ